MVSGVAAELSSRAARVHHGGDVPPVRQEALADEAAVSVVIALAAGERLIGDQP